PVPPRARADCPSSPAAAPAGWTPGRWTPGCWTPGPTAGPRGWRPARRRPRAGRAPPGRRGRRPAGRRPEGPGQRATAPEHSMGWTARLTTSVNGPNLPKCVAKCPFIAMGESVGKRVIALAGAAGLLVAGAAVAWPPSAGAAGRLVAGTAVAWPSLAG